MNTDKTTTGSKTATGKTKETGVALNTNQVLMKGLEVVNTKLKTLSFIFGATFRTHGESKLGSINLHKAVNVAMLVSILGQLLAKERDYNAAGALLNLKTFPVFSWEGYPLDAWQHDIALRISQITQSENEKELKEIQADLTTLMTNEDKLSIIMQRLQKMA